MIPTLETKGKDELIIIFLIGENKAKSLKNKKINFQKSDFSFQKFYISTKI